MKWTKRSEYIKLQPTDAGFTIDPSLVGMASHPGSPSNYRLDFDSCCLRGVDINRDGHIVFDARWLRSVGGCRPHTAVLYKGLCPLGDVCIEFLPEDTKHTGAPLTALDILCPPGSDLWAVLQSPLGAYDKTLDLPEAFTAKLCEQVQCTPTRLELIDCEREEVVSAYWEEGALRFDRASYIPWPAGTYVRITDNVG